MKTKDRWSTVITFNKGSSDSMSDVLCSLPVEAWSPPEAVDQQVVTLQLPEQHSSVVWVLLTFLNPTHLLYVEAVLHSNRMYKPSCIFLYLCKTSWMCEAL